MELSLSSCSLEGLHAMLDRPLLEHGRSEAMERDMNDLETTLVAPSSALVQSLPKVYQGMAQLPSVTPKEP
jgi:hypothetical protein